MAHKKENDTEAVQQNKRFKIIPFREVLVDMNPTGQTAAIPLYA